MNKYLKRWVSLLLFGYLFLSLLQLPNLVVKNDHDLGSQAAYEYWLVNGFQYGIDFLQNVGPYGFLNYPLIYSGFLYYIKILLNVFLVLSFLHLIPKLSFEVFLIFVLSLLFYYQNDVFLYILLHIAFLHILRPSVKHKLVLSLFIVALLCLAKSTCLFVTLWGVIVLVSKSHLNREKYVCKVLLFFLFLTAMWTISGQPLHGLFPYIKGAILFSQGYNEAMAWQEPLYVTFAAVCVGLYYVCQLKKRLTYTQPHLKICFVIESLFFLFLFFAVWKHGMVRADEGHFAIFFAYAIFAISMNYMIPNKVDDTKLRQIHTPHPTFPVIILLSTFFLFLSSHTTLDNYIIRPLTNAGQNLRYLLNIQSVKNILDKQLVEFKNNIHLPEFEKITNGRKIGYLGINPAVMLYNDFNYSTNPSTVSLAAWNTKTMLADAAFFGNKVDYLIVEIKTLDQRYLPIDSSLSKLEILRGFSFVAESNKFVLFKKNTYANTPTFSTVSVEPSYIVGDWHTLPTGSEYTWMTIKLKSNPLESLLSILYKPMTYEIEFKLSSDKIKNYRFLPALGREGFMLSPEILDNKDLLNYFTHPSVKYESPTEFRVICKGPKLLCKGEGTLHFFDVKGL